MAEKTYVGSKEDTESVSVKEKYEKLHEECSKNPTIVLGNEGSKPYVYHEPKSHAKEGFIEKFGKSSMLTHEIEKCGRKVEAVPDSKKPTIEQQRRLDSEISSKSVNQNPDNK